jgi:hypothetical protein
MWQSQAFLKLASDVTSFAPLPAGSMAARALNHLKVLIMRDIGAYGGASPFPYSIKSDRICRTIRSVEPADSTIDA